MAEDSDLEKTESATGRRLEQAREEGDVPRSRELATCTILLAAGMGLWFSGGGMVKQLNHLLTSGMSLDRAQVYDFNLLWQRLEKDLIDVVLAFAPLAGLLVIVALASPLLIGGWLFSGKALQPNFARMNPLNGLGNLISKNALVELIKAVAKAGLVGVVAWMVISRQIEPMLGLAVEPVKNGSAHMVSLLLTGFISIVSSLVVIALIDAPYQLWHYAEKLKMTKEEVKQEHKEAEGNPQIKAKIRQLQREMARRRMMTEIPKADVVVTNPTHFAVALKYADGKMRAPVVIAKGADDVAAKIREIAAENKVPMLEAPPLARALYKHTELGDEIPTALYTAVAEVLAYVFQLRAYNKNGGARPNEPSDIAVPPELDPMNPVAIAAAQAKLLNSGLMQ
jgi:flagellar biosynthetic protein FlhB